MNLVLILTFIILFQNNYCSSIITFHAFNDSCEKIDYSLFKDKGSTTLYDDIRGHGTLNNKDCSPVQIWMLNRHGIRNNNYDSVSRMKFLLSGLKTDILKANREGKGNLCFEDISAIKLWKFDDSMLFQASFLTNSGRVQSFKNGERMRDHFPSLLNNSYDSDKFYFGYGNSERTIQTCRSFAEGMFQNDDQFSSRYLGKMDLVADMDCLSWRIVPIEKDYEKLLKSYEFAESSRIFELLPKSISDRTGIPSTFFNKSTVMTLFEACAYETARDLHLSPWCRLFTLEDLKLMINREQNFHYYLVSYGSMYKDRFACKEIKDLVQTFNDTVENQLDRYVLKAYFTHDGLIEQALTKMSCFKNMNGEPPKQSEWNIGNITPFGATFVAVLYRCESQADKYEIQLFLNEKPIGCCLNGSADPCSWQQFYNHLAEFALNCNEDFCDENDGNELGILNEHFNAAFFVTPNFNAYLFLIVFLIVWSFVSHSDFSKI